MNKETQKRPEPQVGMTTADAKEMWQLIESQELVTYRDSKVEFQSSLARLFPKADIGRICHILDDHRMNYRTAAEEYIARTCFEPEPPTGAELAAADRARMLNMGQIDMFGSGNRKSDPAPQLEMFRTNDHPRGDEQPDKTPPETPPRPPVDERVKDKTDSLIYEMLFQVAQKRGEGLQGNYDHLLAGAPEKAGDEGDPLARLEEAMRVYRATFNGHTS